MSCIVELSAAIKSITLHSDCPVSTQKSFSSKSCQFRDLCILITTLGHLGQPRPLHHQFLQRDSKFRSHVPKTWRHARAEPSDKRQTHKQSGVKTSDNQGQIQNISVTFRHIPSHSVSLTLLLSHRIKGLSTENQCAWLKCDVTFVEMQKATADRRLE